MLYGMPLRHGLQKVRQPQLMTSPLAGLHPFISISNEPQRADMQGAHRGSRLQGLHGRRAEAAHLAEPEHAAGLPSAQRPRPKLCQVRDAMGALHLRPCVTRAWRTWQSSSARRAFQVRNSSTSPGGTPPALSYSIGRRPAACSYLGQNGGRRAPNRPRWPQRPADHSRRANSSNVMLQWFTACQGLRDMDAAQSSAFLARRDTQAPKQASEPACMACATAVPPTPARPWRARRAETRC